MNFSIKPKDPAKLDVDVLIFFSFKEDLTHVLSFGPEVNNHIKQAAEREDFKGDDKEFLTIYTKGLISPYKIIIVGAGEKDKFDLYKLRKVVARAVTKAKEAKPKKIALVPPFFDSLSTQEIIQAVVESCKLSTYQFLKYKSKEKLEKTKQIEECIIQVTPGKLTITEKALKVGKEIAQATCFARDLVNEPANEITPSYLAQVAKDIGKEGKDKIKVKIFEEKAIKKLGMNAYLGVSQGSAQPPKFIRLEYKPKNPSKKVVLVGKGITFDTGGLSIKTSKGMELMKMDMAGGAAILAVFKALPVLSPGIHVVGLVAACENMPSSRAVRPGDILKSLSGKTIEVVNTDAEGRLTLADVLTYAKTMEKPDVVVDIATLTGSCMVALGLEIAGLWGNDDKLIKDIQTASKSSGEKLWLMPLESEYKKLIKSDVADLRNVEKGRYGGSITAALFLSEFIDNTPWIHIDIAGSAFAYSSSSLIPKGGTGFGVRLILHYLLDL